MTKAMVKRIADKTVDAYSRARYTDAGWSRIISRLADEGASEAEIIWVLESKHMRWGADAANRSHSATSADFHAYVTSPHVGSYAKLIQTARIELAKGNPVHGIATAKIGADLAGNCEGEDIADLIDFVNAHAATGNKRAAEIIARIKSRA